MRKNRGGLPPQKLMSFLVPASCPLPGLLLDRERQQGDITRSLDGHCQLALVKGTVARDPPGQDLTPLGDVLAQLVDVLVIDRGPLAGTVDAEAADLLLPLAAFSFQVPA